MVKKMTLDELYELWERPDVERIENNGVSGIDGCSIWHTVYYVNGEE